jgi:hypothetical protein
VLSSGINGAAVRLRGDRGPGDQRRYREEHRCISRLDGCSGLNAGNLEEAVIPDGSPGLDLCRQRC